MGVQTSSGGQTSWLQGPNSSEVSREEREEQNKNEGCISQGMGCPFAGTPAGSGGASRWGSLSWGPSCGGMEKRLSGLRGS